MAETLSFRETEERFCGVFHTDAIAFVCVGLDCRLRAVNEPMCRMLGYSERELLGRTYMDLTHPDDHIADEALRLRVLAGETTNNHIEKRYYHKDGHVVWGLLAVSLVRTEGGEPAYFAAQITDITRQKATEEELARHADELQRSNAELEEFASLASHDLQEPLRTVTSYSQLLAERYANQLDDTGTRWIAYIVGGVGRMRRLIDDMLALAKVRTDGSEFHATDVGKLVALVWSELQQQYGGMRAKLEVGALPIVNADALQLEVLIRNLLANALKYRRAGVPVEIRVAAERVSGTRGDDVIWQFSVVDNGIGLDMIHAERIFEIFHRLHREEQYEGTGIGLAISKRIVDRHGGRIWVESVPNQGATFRFTLGTRDPHRR
jgi:PAS domain S-box-containing protein